MAPVISVLLSTFNCDKYLGAAILSILEQSFQDYEFIIVDDGSLDNTESVLSYWCKVDDRINVFRNPSNMGLAYSLNTALSHSRGRLIARMDADDVARKSRFQKQVDSFSNDAELVVCGTNALHVNEFLRPVSLTYLPTKDWDIRCVCLNENPFAHSSVMMRKDALRRVGGYDVRYDTSQDYELWTRLLDQGHAINIEDQLMLLRRHSESVYEKKRNLQKENTETIRKAYVKKFFCNELEGVVLMENLNSTIFVETRCRDLSNYNPMSESEDILKILSLLQCLYPEQRKTMYPQYLFGKCLIAAILSPYRWKGVRNMGSGIWTYGRWWLKGFVWILGIGRAYLSVRNFIGVKSRFSS